MMNNELMSSKSHPVPHALKWAVGISTVIPAGILTMALLLTGCIGLSRNGEYFPNTRYISEECHSPSKYGYENCLKGIECACYPFALATDIVLFPYDMCLRTKGFQVRVLDDGGGPVAGASIRVGLNRGIYGENYIWTFYEGKTNSRGELYVPRFLENCDRSYENIALHSEAKSFQPSRDIRPRNAFAQDMKTNDWTIIMHRERKE